MSRPKLFKATVWKKKAKRIWIYESKLISTKTNFIPELREVRLEVSYQIGHRQRPKSATRPWLGRELSRQRREQRVSICVECVFFWTIRWIGSLFEELIGNKTPNNKSKMSENTITNVEKNFLRIFHLILTWMSPQYHLSGLSEVKAEMALIVESNPSPDFKDTWTVSIVSWRLWMWTPLSRMILWSKSCGADWTKPWMKRKYSASGFHFGMQSEATILEKEFVFFKCQRSLCNICLFLKTNIIPLLSWSRLNK